MAERKTIGEISVITDSETSYDNIGDIDGGFSSIELENHIKKYGHLGICEQLAVMQWQVWETVRSLNEAKQKEQSVSVNKVN